MLNQAKQLIDLAHEPSSERRRELLRRMSDMFIELEDSVTPDDQNEFTQTASLLLDQLAVEVRTEFAERFADLPTAPAKLMARLAHDVIEVARPVLARSLSLDDPELVAVAMIRSLEHVRAITARPKVSEMVTDVVVQRGDDQALVTLIENVGARFSREAFEHLADRSEAVVALRRPLAQRADTPLDLVHELMVFVEDALREEIVARVSAAPPVQVEAALRAARLRAEARRRADPDGAELRREIAELKAEGRLTKSAVADFLRSGEEPRFVVGLAALLEIDVSMARRLWGAETLDPLAIALRATGADRAFFVTLALVREGATVRDQDRARILGNAFDAIPMSAAQRVIRFWRVRRDPGLEDAA